MNRNDLAGSSQGHAEMAGAVVRTFVGVNQKRQILRNEMIEKGVQVRPRFGVSILHDDQAGGGVADECGYLPARNSRLCDEVPEIVSNLVGALTFGVYGDFAGVGFKIHLAICGVSSPQKLTYQPINGATNRPEQRMPEEAVNSTPLPCHCGPEAICQRRQAHSRSWS